MTDWVTTEMADWVTIIAATVAIYLTTTLVLRAMHRHHERQIKAVIADRERELIASGRGDLVDYNSLRQPAVNATFDADEFDYGERDADGQFEHHPTIDDGPFVQPVRERYVHNPCGEVTRMGRALAESFARDPGFYTDTFCAACGDYYPVEQFRWEETGKSLEVIE